MVTKLDIERQNAETRKMREINIKGLNERMTIAKNTLCVLPRDNSLESQKERSIVQNEIKHLQELIDSEQGAINMLGEANEVEISSIVANL